MRIGLLYPSDDPIGPTEWSGTPAGLASGFAALGVEVVPIGAGLPPGFHHAVALLARIRTRNMAINERLPIRRAARGIVLRLTIERALPLDGIVAMSTELYDLAAVIPEGVPCVTYDDATLAQMWEHPDSDLRQYGYERRFVERWIHWERQSAGAADVNCVSTQWAAASFSRHYGVPAESVRVVGMGHRSRSQLGGNLRDWSSPRYLFVGIDWERKNGDAVIAAFRLVRERQPTATLHLVGRIPPIHEPGVVSHGLLKRDDFAAQQLLDELFASSTCFVLPSKFDPSPIAYLEAGSAGLPVVATSEGGAGELLGEGALTVPPGDINAIAAAMLRLTDPVDGPRRGSAASTAAADATWQQVASRILDAFPSQPGMHRAVRADRDLAGEPGV
ncbi:glycosyltransferase family 4 protein [Diaminobutyricimonas sp. LJ205]|uniref:glycosyltransferase family 4 protein n=1 Tax=Diaminobutyricimonas sp. LJ205 TaxID=2683590 RepID=UPI0012F4850F|nr:glycosyltransferase family 4 protein [Diaminobutyricimonas sp. LJ205]